MKKVICFLIVLSMLATVAFANPVAIGEYGGTVFNSILKKIGLGPTIGLEVIFLLIMFGLAICLSRKSLDVNNKPENKKSFTTIAIIIIVITLITGYLLINETISQSTHGGYFMSEPIDVDMSGPFDL